MVNGVHERPMSVTVARSLAEEAGYGFEVLGGASAMPVIVEMEAHSTAFIMLLRDAGIKAGRFGGWWWIRSARWFCLSGGRAREVRNMGWCIAWE